MRERRADAVLAAVHLAAGTMQLVVPYPRLVADPRLAALEDLSPRATKALGAAQVAASVALMTGRCRAAAAVGLLLVQLGALGVHLRRRDFGAAPVNVVLVALASRSVRGPRGRPRGHRPGPRRRRG